MSTENDWYRLMLDISDETCISKQAVEWTHYAVRQLLDEKGGKSVSGEEIVPRLIAAVATQYKDVAATLTGWNINSSEDVGRIMFALDGKGIFKREPQDTADSFAGIFTPLTLKSYIASLQEIPAEHRYAKFLATAGCALSIGLILLANNFDNYKWLAWLGWIMLLGSGLALHHLRGKAVMPAKASRQ